MKADTFKKRCQHRELVRVWDGDKAERLTKEWRCMDCDRLFTVEPVAENTEKVGPQAEGERA